MIYFTSDLHFWHKNAIIYTNRPFETVEEMNEKLIEYWNKTVHANDEVYILGDVTMVRPGRATEIISRLTMTILPGKSSLNRRPAALSG